jgi:hypothetical protein
MRTTFKVSMAAAGALLATVAMPITEEVSVSADTAVTLQSELLASGNCSNVRRPMLDRADNLVAKSA